MKKWNPFGKVDIETGSFIEKSRFNKDYAGTDFERSFDIDDVSFENVSRDFENKFRKRYRNALEAMSDGGDELKQASGASTLGVLEKMARSIDTYDRSSDFSDSYDQLLKEGDRFSET